MFLTCINPICFIISSVFESGFERKIVSSIYWVFNGNNDKQWVFQNKTVLKMGPSPGELAL